MRQYNRIETYTAGGVVIQEATGKVLVVEQVNSTWSLPKGHIDFGEDALSAAKREIKEESGVRRLRLINKIGNYSRYKMGLNGEDDISELKNMVFFLFYTPQKKLRPEDIENPSAQWINKEKVASLLTHSKDKDFFNKLLDSLLLTMALDTIQVNTLI